MTRDPLRKERSSASSDELTDLEKAVAVDLERWRLAIAREYIQVVMEQAVRVGKQSVDREKEWDDGPNWLAVQQRESEVHGMYVRYLQKHLDDLDRRLQELDT